MTNKIFIITVLAFSTMCLSAQDRQEASTYLDAQTEVLNNIRPLQTHEKQQFDSIFWVQWEEHGRSEIALHEAMCGALTVAQYFRQYFKDQIDKRAWVIFNDDINYFKQRQKLPERSLEKIKPILQERSKETAYCEYRFFTDSKKRADAITAVRDKYRESISKVTIKDNSSGASYNLGLVLENRETLNLSDKQIDSIVAAVQQIRQLSKNGVITREKNNRWEYERIFIIQHLNEEQVGGFVNIRNFDYAKSYAEKMWKDMDDYNISFEYNKEEIITEIIMYQLSKERIKYVYKDDPERLKELDDYLYKTSYPKSLKHLRVEKRKKNSQEAEEKDLLIF